MYGIRPGISGSQKSMNEYDRAQGAVALGGGRRKYENQEDKQVDTHMFKNRTFVRIKRGQLSNYRSFQLNRVVGNAGILEHVGRAK